MNKRHALYVVLCLVFSFSTVLYIYSRSTKPNSEKNGFTRIFRTTGVATRIPLRLKYANYYLIGATDNRVYFSNFRTPRQFYETSYNLLDTVSRNLIFDERDTMAWRSVRMVVDSPFVFVGDGVTARIMIAAIEDGTMRPMLERRNYFLSFKPISNGSVVLKSIDASTKQTVLIRQQINKPFEKFPNWKIEAQVDGFFSTDGMLNYDKKTNTFAYVCYYRNDIYFADSMLNIVRKGSTIDTNTIAKIKVGEIESKNRVALASPASFVNKVSCADNGRLYVHSGVLADNEQKEKFDQNAIVDVYSMTEASYLFSFYIPVYKDEKMRDFIVRNDKIICMYDHMMSVFNIVE